MRAHLQPRRHGYREVVLPLATCYLVLALWGCGFHLRGQGGSAALPPQLSELRVRALNAGSALKADLERALIGQAGVRIVSDARERTPTLTLYEERSFTQAVSVAQDARVSELLVRYELEFGLTDAADKPLLGRQSVALQRSLSFDRFNVLAKEREVQETTAQMREDAVQQIVRRLATVGQQ